MLMEVTVIICNFLNNKAMKKVFIIGSLLLVFFAAIAVQDYTWDTAFSEKKLQSNLDVTDKRPSIVVDNHNMVVEDLQPQKPKYREIFYPTPNIDKTRINTI